MLLDVCDLHSTLHAKPLMGVRLVLGWVEGVALASEACADMKLGGEMGVMTGEGDSKLRGA